MANERFLVTGALGCIGAWVVRNLNGKGKSECFDHSINPEVGEITVERFESYF